MISLLRLKISHESLRANFLELLKIIRGNSRAAIRGEDLYLAK